MDSSPLSEINYMEHVLAQNSMDVEFNDTVRGHLGLCLVSIEGLFY